jgi:hypothetical protein
MTTRPLDLTHPDVIAALERYDGAVIALGPDLAGHSLVDLLADNFATWSLEHCRQIAAACRELRA